MPTMVPGSTSHLEEGPPASSSDHSAAPPSTGVRLAAAGCTCERPQWRFGGPAWGELHEACERPEWLVCLGCDARTLKRCGRSSRVVCGPCSETYRRRVARVAHSGMVISREGDVYVLTLTAPGDARHRKPDGEWCECTPEGGVDLARWNGSAGLRWSRFVDALRYRFGDVQFFKAAEVQTRGALHFHAPLVLEPGTVVKLSEVRALAIEHGFGHSVKLDRLPAGSSKRERAGWYVAKYVSKSSTDRESVPFVDRRTGEVGPGRWRTWSASRRWGLTMAALRQQQREWVQRGGPEGPPVEALAPGSGGARRAPLDPNTHCSGKQLTETPSDRVALPM